MVRIVFATAFYLVGFYAVDALGLAGVEIGEWLVIPVAVASVGPVLVVRSSADEAELASDET